MAERELRSIDISGGANDEQTTYKVVTLCVNCGDQAGAEIPKGTPAPFGESLKGCLCRYCGCESLQRRDKPPVASKPMPPKPTGTASALQQAFVQEMQRQQEAADRARGVAPAAPQPLGLPPGASAPAAGTNRTMRDRRWTRDYTGLVDEVARQRAANEFYNHQLGEPIVGTPSAQPDYPLSLPPGIYRNEWGNWDHETVQPMSFIVEPDLANVAEPSLEVVAHVAATPRASQLSHEQMQALPQIQERGMISRGQALAAMGIVDYKPAE